MRAYNPDMTKKKVGYVLALLLLPLLAACKPATVEESTPSTAIATVNRTVPTETDQLTVVQATPTQEATPIATFEGIELPEGTGRLYEIGGQWLYDTPSNVLVGKEVVMVVNHHVNSDGSVSIWMAPEDFPNAPLFIKDGSSEEWRRGPFGYEDVENRYTFPTEGVRNGSAIVAPYEGSVAPLGFLNRRRSSGGDSDIYLLSGIALGGFVESNGLLSLPMAASVMKNEEGFMYYFNWILGDVRGVSALEPSYVIQNSARNDNQYSNLAHISDEGRAEFSSNFSPGSQIVFLGITNVLDGLDVSRTSLPGNFSLAVEYGQQIEDLIRILETGDYRILQNSDDPSVLSGVAAIMLKQ